MVTLSSVWDWKYRNGLVQPGQDTEGEGPCWRCGAAQLQLCSTLTPFFPPPLLSRVAGKGVEEGKQRYLASLSP